jgi:hypothetical protein
MAWHVLNKRQPDYPSSTAVPRSNASTVLTPIFTCPCMSLLVASPQGVGQLVLESPYYGARRPPQQRGSKLCAVSDLLALGW